MLECFRAGSFEGKYLILDRQPFPILPSELLMPEQHCGPWRAVVLATSSLAKTWRLPRLPASILFPGRGRLSMSNIADVIGQAAGRDRSGAIRDQYRIAVPMTHSETGMNPGANCCIAARTGAAAEAAIQERQLRRVMVRSTLPSPITQSWAGGGGGAVDDGRGLPSTVSDSISSTRVPSGS
jgi:hypothetical protein